MERPEYRSKTYYNVVLGSEKFNGWRNIFAGDGTLIFRHDSGKEEKFNGGTSIGWLERAWNQFINMAASDA